MATISSSGVGSGLDVAGLVKKLVEAEGAPKSLQLDKAEAKVQAKLSALGSLRSALATFRDSLTALKSASKFQGRAATLSVPDFLTASAGTTAVPGSYSVEVDRLASAHKLQSGDYLSADAIVGTGTLTIETGGETFDVGEQLLRRRAELDLRQMEHSGGFTRVEDLLARDDFPHGDALQRPAMRCGGGPQLFGRLRVDSLPARCVLAVRDHEVRTLFHPTQKRRHRAPAGTTDHVAEKHHAQHQCAMWLARVSRMTVTRI